MRGLPGLHESAQCANALLNHTICSWLITIPNKTKRLQIISIMSGAIGGFAQSADRAARIADPHIAQLICR